MRGRPASSGAAPLFLSVSPPVSLRRFFSRSVCPRRLRVWTLGLVGARRSELRLHSIVEMRQLASLPPGRGSWPRWDRHIHESRRSWRSLNEYLRVNDAKTKTFHCESLLTLGGQTNSDASYLSSCPTGCFIGSSRNGDQRIDLET